MRDIGQKLRRLLYMVPYVAKHADGVEVGKLAKLLDLDRDELLGELELLSQVGPPDGDPGEYLAVSVEEGRVYVDLAHRLTRPLRLTPAEGCSLLVGIRALRQSGVAPYDEAMASAERKLLGALGGDAAAVEDLATGTVVAEPEGVVAAHLRQLMLAARKKKRVEVEYVSASRHQGQWRTIDPYGLVYHTGEWYVVGYCHKRGDIRTFRVDRIAAMRAGDASFVIPREFDLDTYRREQLYVPSADAVEVRVHLDPLAVTRIGSNWPVGEVSYGDDGSADIAMDCEGLEWVTGWVLGFGRHARIASPPEARQALVAKLGAIVAHS